MIRLIAAIAAAAMTLPVPSPGPGGTTTAKFGVWTVHMTVVNYNLKTGDFNTPNHVSMTRIGGDVNADRAKGNIKTKHAILTGHVVMHDMSGAMSPAAPGKVAAMPLTSAAPSTLMADIVQIDQTAARYIATGNMQYAQGEMVLTARSGTLDQASHTMTADGDVHIQKGEQTLVAEHVTCNTLSGACQAHKGTVDLPAAGMPGGPR